MFPFRSPGTAALVPHQDHFKTKLIDSTSMVIFNHLDAPTQQNDNACILNRLSF